MDQQAPTGQQQAAAANTDQASGGATTTIVTPKSPKHGPTKAPQSPQATKTAKMGQGRARNDSWGDQKQAVMKMPKPIPI